MVSERKWTWGVYNKLIGERNDRRVLELLKKAPMERQRLEKESNLTNITNKISKLSLIQVRFCLKRGSGAYRRFTTEEIFLSEYCFKFYIARPDDRTGIIRLLFKAIKKNVIKDKHLRKTLRAFLRNYLSSAEIIALYHMLGVRNWPSTVIKKSSIQLDGVVMPQGRWKLNEEET